MLDLVSYLTNKTNCHNGEQHISKFCKYTWIILPVKKRKLYEILNISNTRLSNNLSPTLSVLIQVTAFNHCVKKKKKPGLYVKSSPNISNFSKWFCRRKAYMVQRDPLSKRSLSETPMRSRFSASRQLTLRRIL